MGSIIAIVAIVMGVSIPVTAIISSALVKIKRMKLEEHKGITSEEKEMLLQVLQENESLKQRVENLEMVTSDPNLLKIHATKEADLQHQIDTLKQELLKLNQQNTH